MTNRQKMVSGKNSKPAMNAPRKAPETDVDVNSDGSFWSVTPSSKAF
jgi:hypothetical protein